MKRLLAVMATSLAVGCGNNPCPDRSVTPLDDSTWVAPARGGTGGAVVERYRTDAPRKLEIDRTKGIVRVSFAIDGHTVVETWRIRGSQTVP